MSCQDWLHRVVPLPRRSISLVTSRVSSSMLDVNARVSFRCQQPASAGISPSSSLRKWAGSLDSGSEISPKAEGLRLRFRSAGRWQSRDLVQPKHKSIYDGAEPSGRHARRHIASDPQASRYWSGNVLVLDGYQRKPCARGIWWATRLYFRVRLKRFRSSTGPLIEPLDPRGRSISLRSPPRQTGCRER